MAVSSTHGLIRRFSKPFGQWQSEMKSWAKPLTTSKPRHWTDETYLKVRVNKGGIPIMVEYRPGWYTCTQRLSEWIAEHDGSDSGICDHCNTEPCECVQEQS